jgi:putative SOS response-associated peptidase YedK
VKEWTLHDEDTSRTALMATLDESAHINAAGDRLVPLLQFHFNWERWVDRGRVSVESEVVAVCLSLYPNESNSFSPWVQTGLLPRRSNSRLSLPLTHQLIEELTRKASEQAEHVGEVSWGTTDDVRP